MSMSQQNKANHRRLSPMYHGVLMVLVLLSIVLSVYYFISHTSLTDTLSILILSLHSIALLVLMLLTRVFALKAQDRAIRAEESLRHFILSGKPIDSRLSLNQIIALRFASDEELIALTEKTVTEGLAPNQIKSLIKDWKADTYRV